MEAKCVCLDFAPVGLDFPRLLSYTPYVVGRSMERLGANMFHLAQSVCRRLELVGDNMRRIVQMTEPGKRAERTRDNE